uniref:WD repeat domain 74 n=1 Tax=Neogobius melanostomus TaxID=47308 RepID=A0A8C6SGF9_9GOBI
MDVWLGAETGLLKGVSVSRKQAVNFSSSGREQEVRALCWGGAGETEVLVGQADGIVRTFSTEKGAFTISRRCGEAGEGCFSGLLALGPALATCTEKGAVRVWKEDGDEAVTEVRAGGHVKPSGPHRVATGGKENPLKIWDLENPDKPVFSAKNLRDTYLDLRQPHWVRDMAFLPESDKVVTCTSYHQVHIFDPSSPRRRPVLEAVFGEYPLTALSLPADGLTVAVANTQGQMGATGSVRALQCHPSLPLIASCGLDRFLRIHSLQDRKLQHKVYLKSRLNCLLFSSSDPNTEAPPLKVKEEEEEEDEVWDAMEYVHERGGVHEEEEVNEEDRSVDKEDRSVDKEDESVQEDEVQEDEEDEVQEEDRSVDKEEVQDVAVKTKRKTEAKDQKKRKKRKKGQD